MKKLTVILLLIMLGYTSQGTNVTGGIYTNTTWTLAGSPYIVTDTIMVFPGITLTIEPGVVVKFNSDGLLDIRGSLYAHGTPNDSIIFTSNQLNPMPNDYTGIQIQSSATTVIITWCRISFAYQGIYSFNSLSAPMAHSVISFCDQGISRLDNTVFDTCTFKNNYIGIYPSVDAFYGCAFTNNSNAIANSDACPYINCAISNNINAMTNGDADTITKCIVENNTNGGLDEYAGIIDSNLIEYNNVGITSTQDTITQNIISNNYIGIETGGQDKIYCNSICNNTDFNLITETSNNISVPDNYWCLPDSAGIQATIYDGHQKLILGLVYFMPFDITPCSNITTGTSQPQIANEGIKVFPNPNNGAFSIELNGIIEKPIIEIYNMLGQQIFRSELNISTTEINLSAQPKGMYLYRVLTQVDSSLVGEGKVIIQ